LPRRRSASERTEGAGARSVQGACGAAFLGENSRFARFRATAASVRSAPMEYGSSLVRVLGVGHLAAAVRVRLGHLRPCASEMDCENNHERPALFLACSDFENACLRRTLSERARDDRCSVLFACLLGDSVRVGPLATPCSLQKFSAHYLTRSWDFSPGDARGLLVPPGEWVTHTADIRMTRMAQIGATCVVGELAKLLSVAGRTRLIERVAENDSPAYFGEWDLGGDLPGVGSGRSFVARLDGTVVATDDAWREVCRVPARVWHPAGVG
jgi:hypothetical protein